MLVGNARCAPNPAPTRPRLRESTLRVAGSIPLVDDKRAIFRRAAPVWYGPVRCEVFYKKLSKMARSVPGPHGDDTNRSLVGTVRQRRVRQRGPETHRSQCLHAARSIRMSTATQRSGRRQTLNFSQCSAGARGARFLSKNAPEWVAMLPKSALPSDVIPSPDRCGTKRNFLSPHWAKLSKSTLSEIF